MSASCRMRFGSGIEMQAQTGKCPSLVGMPPVCQAWLQCLRDAVHRLCQGCFECLVIGIKQIMRQTLLLVQLQGWAFMPDFQIEVEFVEAAVNIHHAPAVP